MRKLIQKTAGSLVLLAASILIIPAAMALTVDDLAGVWSMTYDMGQGAQTGGTIQGAQTGTITVTKGADGSPAISMNTQSGGSSSAKNVKIDGDMLTFSRDISAQGQALSVNYKAQLVDGKLQGSFEVDLGAAAPAGAPGATVWTATKQ